MLKMLKAMLRSDVWIGYRLVIQHRLENFIVIRPFTNDAKGVKSLNCEGKARGNNFYELKILGIDWQLPALFFSVLVAWYVLILNQDRSYALAVGCGGFCYTILSFYPVKSFAAHNRQVCSNT